MSVVENNEQLHTYLIQPLSQDLLPKISTSYTALQLASIYNFPNGNGLGQKIGIISLGGGYTMTDVNTYLLSLGINVTPNITNISINGAVNNPSDPSGASIEVTLDLQIVLAIVPRASIRMYFAPNSFSGFYNAINQAIIDQCNIVSISWGLYESGYGSSNLTAYNNLFNTGANQGVTFCVAAGDNGSSDGYIGNNVDFPASSPYVVACSGTTLNASNNVRMSETVWNNNSTSSATGGGVSKFFSKPSYQNSITSISMRGVGDISCNADPNTGYRIYYRGNWTVIGGTSASAPLMAGLFARINQIANTNVGFIHSNLYNNNIYYDIVSGNNGAFSATVHWDPCSGLGVIDGQQLLSLYSTNSTPVSSFTYNINNLTVAFVNTSTNATSYEWQFGDSQTSTLTNPNHTYSVAGVYTVTLIASNNNGSDSSVKTITFTVTSDFTASPLYGVVPLTVQFNNISAYASNYLWQFGNNQTSTLTNPSHIYNTAGIYSVSLAADTTVKTRTNYITVVNSNFQANFSYMITSSSRRRVQFVNTSTGSPTSYKWNFGNGTYSSLKNPLVTFNKVGTYTVILTIYKNNISSTTSQQITV